MDELTRFAQRLIEQLGTNGGTVNRAVSVGALRETILPYRSHRRALGLSSVEDYETVLLRLVAEEGGYVKTVPSAAADRCREVLAETNPDLGVLDEVADSTIQVTSMAAGRIVADEAVPPPAPIEPVVRPTATLPEDDGNVRIGKRHAPKAEAAAAPPPASPAPADSPAVVPHKSKDAPAMTEACAHCSKPIPMGRQVVFCPWCGQRLIPFTCARCGTELDSEWQHCITCGAPAKDPYRFP